VFFDFVLLIFHSTRWLGTGPQLAGFESTGQALALESSRKTAVSCCHKDPCGVVVHRKHGRYELARVTLCLSRLPFVEDMVLP
jgi:hypothetical protein